ncbi:MAG: hypothetical protein H6733_13805 [Alphaproteobacteria bacterium]|nr:hypothetical protein [Alphaproteobacteria bacterium]
MRHPLLLVLPAALLALQLGCPCPTAPCPAGVLVQLRVGAWQAGTYGLTVSMPDFRLDCRLLATADAKPTLHETDCNELVFLDDYVPDTGGAIDPHLVELQGTLSRPVDGAALPATAAVVLTHTVGDATTELVRADVPLDWHRRVQTTRACVDDCRATVVEVTAP